jgi:hypothetical protein
MERDIVIPRLTSADGILSVKTEQAEAYRGVDVNKN